MTGALSLSFWLACLLPSNSSHSLFTIYIVILVRGSDINLPLDPTGALAARSLIQTSADDNKKKKSAACRDRRLIEAGAVKLKLQIIINTKPVCS